VNVRLNANVDVVITGKIEQTIH